VGQIKRYCKRFIGAIVPYWNDWMTSYLKNLSLRQGAGWIALACAAMLGFGLYLQHVAGLEPCPMCIVQRYALILVAACAVFTLLIGQKGLQTGLAVLATGFAGFGAFVAARQSFLQWYPPQELSCGRDFYGMVETFPLKRAIPMIFKGSGDCTKVDWTFLGGSIANWSFVAFVGMALVFLILLFRRSR
jgi:protein dithiol:quinone oxidoreductase